jgi:hypothetical protein
MGCSVEPSGEIARLEEYSEPADLRTRLDQSAEAGRAHHGRANAVLDVADELAGHHHRGVAADLGLGHVRLGAHPPEPYGVERSGGRHRVVGSLLMVAPSSEVPDLRRMCRSRGRE